MPTVFRVTSTFVASSADELSVGSGDTVLSNVSASALGTEEWVRVYYELDPLKRRGLVPCACLALVSSTPGPSIAQSPLQTSRSFASPASTESSVHASRKFRTDLFIAADEMNRSVLEDVARVAKATDDAIERIDRLLLLTS